MTIQDLIDKANELNERDIIGNETCQALIAALRSNQINENLLTALDLLLCEIEQERTISDTLEKQLCQ